MLICCAKSSSRWRAWQAAVSALVPAPSTAPSASAPSAPELAPLAAKPIPSNLAVRTAEGDTFRVKVRSDQEEITVEVVVKDDAVVIKGVAGEGGPRRSTVDSPAVAGV